MVCIRSSNAAVSHVLLPRILRFPMTSDPVSDPFSDDPFEREFQVVCMSELEAARDRIRHCVTQLDDDQLWSRPHPSMNSIANLILHLCGNARQWLVAGLQDRPDSRNRPAEFSQRGGLTASELQKSLDDVLLEVRASIGGMSRDQWLLVRDVQGFQISGIQTALDSITHFWGHTQEIVHLTRAILGDNYRFDFVPGPGQDGNAADS